MAVARRSQGQNLSSTPDSPPHDSDAEAGALGCMMAGDPAAVDEGMRHLCPDDFFEDKHKAIFHAVCQLHQAGKDVNIVSVTHALSDAGKIQDVGGAPYIAGLPNLIPSSASIPDYIARLTEKTRRRRASHLGLALQHGAFNGDVSPETVTEMRSLLEDLTTETRFASCPTFSEEVWAGDGAVFPWPRHGVSVTVEEIREGGLGLRAVSSVESQVEGILWWGELTVASTSARETLCKTLAKKRGDVDWMDFLTRVCMAVHDHARRGAPIVPLLGAVSKPMRYLLRPFLPFGRTAVFYGDTGTLKSTFQMALALSIASGVSLPYEWHPAETMNCLYLDYEDEQEDQDTWIAMLRRGLEIPTGTGKTIYYRKQSRPLADDVQWIRSECARLQIGFVIVDSYGFACNPDMRWDESANSLFNALRFLGTTNAVINHIPVAQIDQEKANPFGGMFAKAGPRALWEMKAIRDQGDPSLIRVTFTNRKMNKAPLHPFMGLRFEFGEGVIHVKEQRVEDDVATLAGAPLAEQIKHHLTTAQTALSVKDLAQKTGKSDAQIRARLNELDGRGVVRLPGGLWEARR